MRNIDKSRAHAWYTKAAELGHPDAQYRLARSSESSASEKVHWLSAIVSRNDDYEKISVAKLHLAQAYNTGDGIAKDSAAAAELYKQLWDNRHNTSIAMRLGEMYLHGDGMALNKTLGLMWLLLANNVWKSSNPRAMHRRRDKRREQLIVLIQQAKDEMTAEEIAAAEQMAQL